jgi:predicted nucleotide-binding protein (sugar kinase/HSP70/actin superfamily)
MVVNAAPFGCMPGTLTTAILRNLQDEMGIPVVGMFYDGTPGLNRSLEPFLNSLKNGLEAESQRLKQKQGHSTSV